MATTYQTVYAERDNAIYVKLSSTDEDGVVTYPDLTAGVTKVEIFLKGVYYDSDDHPSAFDWTTEGEDGIICLKLGNIATLPIVKDSAAEIITYDPSNPDGLVWGTISIRVVELVETT